jgi:hypothetical protein
MLVIASGPPLIFRTPKNEDNPRMRKGVRDNFPDTSRNPLRPAATKKCHSCQGQFLRHDDAFINRIASRLNSAVNR